MKSDRAFAHGVHCSAHIRFLAQHNHRRRRHAAVRSRRNKLESRHAGQQHFGDHTTKVSPSRLGEVAFGAVVILDFGVEGLSSEQSMRRAAVVGFDHCDDGTVMRTEIDRLLSKKAATATVQEKARAAGRIGGGGLACGPWSHGRHLSSERPR